MKTGLLHPYPGSKKDWHKYPVWDERYCYDAWIEPCVGAGHQVHRYLATGIVNRAFIADIDPAVYTVWQAWQDPTLREAVAFSVYRWAESIQKAYATGDEDTLISNFNVLCHELNAPIPGHEVGLAAASIVLRKLVFGGVLRCNAQGTLNVALSKDKLRAFQAWDFKWPYVNPRWTVCLADSAHACLDEFEASDCESAIAFFDPPYWVPKGSRPGRRGTGALTPAYTHHGDPQGEELKELCLSVLERLLSNPRVERIVVTNYISPELAAAVEAMGKGGRAWRLTPLGELTTMNRGMIRDDCPVEGFWEFGGRMMAGRYEQQQLLEVAA